MTSKPTCDFCERRNPATYMLIDERYHIVDYACSDHAYQWRGTYTRLVSLQSTEEQSAVA